MANSVINPYFNARVGPNPDICIFPAWAHPMLRYWAPTLSEIRDCLLGEQEIKAKGQTYLPRMADMDEDEFAAYKGRAVFFNMTTRTVNALVGQLFEKSPEHANVPARVQEAFKTCVYNKLAIDGLEAQIAEALVGPGRYGVLVDQDADGRYDPFLRGYDTENILDWQYDEVKGRYIPVQIVLREFRENRDRRIGQMRSLDVIFRVLSLDLEYDPETGEDKATYRQYVYTVTTLNSANADLTTMEPDVYTPLAFGVPFEEIPFFPFGAKTNTLDMDRPPAADIVSLNLAHYRAYAHLEHGRFFTAIPIYYVSRQGNNAEADYRLGPANVWEIGSNEKAGVIEFNGQGLKTLESSCAQKEDQIAMIGARLMGGYSRSTSESDQQANLKESNERSLLIRIITNIDEGMSKALNLWATWMGETNPSIACKLNTAFLQPVMDARGLRAAQMMYEAGILPITELHGALQAAGLVSDECDIDDFKALLEKVEEFPNNPDVWARQKGYAGAANAQDVKLQRRTLRDTETRTEIMAKQAQIDKLDVEGTIEVKQAQVDVQQQQADIAQQAQDTADAALEHAAEAAKIAAANPAPQITVSAGAKVANEKTTIGGPAPAASGASKPLPSQVASARQAGAGGAPGASGVKKPAK